MERQHKPINVALFRKVCEDNGIRFLPDDGVDLEFIKIRLEDGTLVNVGKDYNILNSIYAGGVNDLKRDEKPIKESSMIMEKIMNTDNKIVVGIPSGDYENFCFDVTKESFIELEGHEPTIHRGRAIDESEFYENLYRVYSIPDVGIWDTKYRSTETLLKVEFNDWGVVSVEETDVPVVRKPEKEW